MAERIGCLHFDQITALLENRLPRKEQTAVVRHLDDCLLCQWRLEQSAGASKELSLLSLAINRDSSALGPSYQQVMESLKGDVPGDSEVPSDGAPPLRALGFLQESQNPVLLGRFGRYEVLETIGRGGMGIVLKARDPLLDRITAIKVLDPLLAGHETARLRFVREARAAAAICHENVIVIYGVAERDGLPYLVMPYIHGMSVAEKIQWFGALELVEILRIGMQIAAGLAAAHAQGVVHRDIKPGNILLEGDVDRVKITDFGLAQVMDDASLTQPGTIAGTPDYMSPEQADERLLDHRSDLFSLGSVLYAMCTSMPPFYGATALAVLRRVCDDEPRPIQQLNPDIPDWLVQIVSKLHQKRPQDRFDSAAEVGELLRQHLARLQSTATARTSCVQSADEASCQSSPVVGATGTGFASDKLSPSRSGTIETPQVVPPTFDQRRVLGWRQMLAWLRTQPGWKSKWRGFWKWMSARAGTRPPLAATEREARRL